MFLSNMLIQVQMKFIATQREISEFKILSSGIGQPPWNSIAPVDIYLGFL